MLKPTGRLPGKDTAAYRLLSLTAVLGELPANQLSRLPGGRSYKETVVKKLKAEKLLRTYYADGVRAYRLTARTKKMLIADNPKRFSFALTGTVETNHVKSEIDRRLRLHRIAEATVSMQNAGVRIFPDGKAELFSPLWERAVEPIFPAFYNAREIKAMGTRFVKIHGARSVGVLLTEDEIFITYNLGNARMKWSYQSEMRTKALIKTVLCRERLPELYSPESVQGLLLGNHMDLAAEILNESSGRQYFLLDGNYTHFYFLTNDRRGERLLHLLCSAGERDELEDLLLSDFAEADVGLPIENDALDETGAPVLLGYLCDLPRIKRFDTALRLQSRTGTILCFDFQKDALAACCGAGVRFQTIDFEKWERKFCEPP